jgi:hypothetical protein
VVCVVETCAYQVHLHGARVVLQYSDGHLFAVKPHLVARQAASHARKTFNDAKKGNSLVSLITLKKPKEETFQPPLEAFFGYEAFFLFLLGFDCSISEIFCAASVVVICLQAQNQLRFEPGVFEMSASAFVLQMHFQAVMIQPLIDPHSGPRLTVAAAALDGFVIEIPGYGHEYGSLLMLC